MIAKIEEFRNLSLKLDERGQQKFMSTGAASGATE